MAETKLKKIPVGSSSESSHIDSRKRYRVKIEGKWYEGSFSKQWFGWKFDNYGSSGMQLNMIDQVFEIVRLDPKKVKKPMAKPPSTPTISAMMIKTIFSFFKSDTSLSFCLHRPALQ
jgi:hypothetical protein